MISIQISVQWQLTVTISCFFVTLWHENRKKKTWNTVSISFILSITVNILEMIYHMSWKRMRYRDTVEKKKITISSTMMLYKIICSVVFDQNAKYKAEAEITYLQPTDSEWLKAESIAYIINNIQNKRK